MEFAKEPNRDWYWLAEDILSKAVEVASRTDPPNEKIHAIVLHVNAEFLLEKRKFDIYHVVNGDMKWDLKVSGMGVSVNGKGEFHELQLDCSSNWSCQLYQSLEK